MVMTAIFISHSSADNAAAAEMKAWLEAQGHTSLFLDFDPETGIKGGSGWEQTLYQNLRQCQAVIALLTPNWLASKWCFAELVQARERGKAIFPVKIQACEAGGVFADIQHIDLTAEPEEGYKRLRIGLLERGIDPLDVFDWDPKRPPYPGLMAFQEQDAAIFFGRGEDVLRTLETLDALRRQGGGAARFALLLGASGSGKSSLARAGVIPRLNKQPAAWLPVPPFRPQENPLEELAVALSAAFNKYGVALAWDELRTGLHKAAALDPVDGRVLPNLVRGLTMAAKQPEATVLLTIDQAEELFGYSPPEAARRFLRLLRAALETADRRLITLATMRSDFLGEFQNHSVLQDQAGEYAHHFRYQAVPVDPMPLRNFPQIIEGPARLGGLQLADGLVEAMVRDTGTRDALPLLAFTLRRLYERHGQDGRLEIRDYEALCGLEGSVREEANRLLEEAQPSLEQLEALHAAFVPAMVRINAEGGYARRRATLLDIPAGAVPLLRRFVDARLLVTDRDTEGREIIEVAHEALLRAWPQLTTWLAEDQDKLRLLESLQRAAEEWDKSGRCSDMLVHRDSRLQDAVTLLANPRFAVADASVERAYLEAGSAAQRAVEAAAKEEQERRIRDAERIAGEQKKAAAAQKKITQRTRIGLAVAVVLMIGAAITGWIAIGQKQEAIKQRQEAVRQRDHAQRLLYASDMNLAQRAFESGNVGQGRGLLESYLVADPVSQQDLRGFEWYYLWRLYNRQLASFDRTDDIAFSRDGAVFATATADALKIWDAASRRETASFKPSGPRNITSGSGVKGHSYSIALSPDGRTLAYGDNERTMLLDISSGSSREVPVRGERQGQRKIQYPEEERVWDWDWVREGEGTRLPRFSPDGKLLAVSYDCGLVAVYDAHSLELITRLGHGRGASACASFVAFSRNGRVLAYGDLYSVRLWDTVASRDLGEPERGISQPDSVGQVEAAAFSPDGQILAIGDRSKRVVLWNISTRKVLARLAGHEGWVTALAFSPDGKILYSGSMDQTVKLWDFRSYKGDGQVSGEKIKVFATIKGHTGWISSINCSPDGRMVATVGGGTAKLWAKAAGREFDAIEGVDAVSPGANIIAKYIDDWTKLGDSARMTLFDLRGGEPAALGMAKGMPPILSPDGKTLATTVSDDGSYPVRRITIKLWDVRTRRELKTLRTQSSERSPTFSPDGRLFTAIGADGKSLILWDVAERKELTPLRNDAALKDYLLSRDGKVIVTVDKDGQRVRSWDAASRRQLASFERTTKRAAGAGGAEAEEQTTVLDLAPNGKSLAFSDSNEVRLWETGSADEPILLGRHEAGVSALAFSPDAKLVAAGDEAGLVKVWDTATRGELSTFKGQKNEVTALAFSPDGRTLASGGDTVKLYAMASMRELITLTHEPSPTSDIHALQGGEDIIHGLFFSADGKSLITRSGNDVLRIWRGASDATVAAKGQYVRVAAPPAEPAAPSRTISPPQAPPLPSPPRAAPSAPLSPSQSPSGVLVGPPDIKIGDTYIIASQYPDNPSLNNTTERKVLAINEGKLIVASKNVKSMTDKPRTLQFTSEWNLMSSRNPDGSGFDYAPPLKYFAFPLYPGKTWKQITRETDIKTGAVREHTLSATVGDWEDVSVPAGTFRAIKITIQTELLDRATGRKSTGTDVSWYAPTLRRSVRSVITSRNFQGREERQYVEVIRQELR
jgi:WD40 repeat protein